jgi:hypothetical protein
VLSSLPSKQEKTPGSPILRAIRVPPDGMVQAEWVRQNTQLSISSGRCSHLPPWLDSHDRDHVRANCVPIRRLEKPHRNCFVVQGLYRYVKIIRRELQESMGKLSDFYQKIVGEMGNDQANRNRGALRRAPPCSGIFRLCACWRSYESEHEHSGTMQKSWSERAKKVRRPMPMTIGEGAAANGARTAAIWLALRTPCAIGAPRGSSCS